MILPSLYSILTAKCPTFLNRSSYLKKRRLCCLRVVTLAIRSAYRSSHSSYHFLAPSYAHYSVLLLDVRHITELKIKKEINKTKKQSSGCWICKLLLLTGHTHLPISTQILPVSHSQNLSSKLFCPLKKMVSSVAAPKNSNINCHAAISKWNGHDFNVTIRKANVFYITWIWNALTVSVSKELAFLFPWRREKKYIATHWGPTIPGHLDISSSNF